MKLARPTNQAKEVESRVTTRNQNVLINNNILERVDEPSKRKAGSSPGQKEPMKRSAFGDVTNPLARKIEEDDQSSLAKGLGSKNVSKLEPSAATSQTVKLPVVIKTKGAINKLYLPSKPKIQADKKKPVKRSAFGDITNALERKNEGDAQSLPAKCLGLKNVYRGKPATAANQIVKRQPVTKTRRTINNLSAPSKPKMQVKPKCNASREKSSVLESVAQLTRVSKLAEELTLLTKQPGPQEMTVKWSVLYTEQITTVNETTTLGDIASPVESSSDSSSTLEELPDSSSTNKVQSKSEKAKDRSEVRRVPYGVCDFDDENINDPSQVSVYAMDIFEYLKSRESKFQIKDYMPTQIYLSPSMRAMLVDWMVEAQENFELDHETLYLGVKLVDHYLSKVTIAKETMQLVGAAALLIASKYDERVPPLVSDFIFLCDGAYTKEELVRMEFKVLEIIGFDLGIPLSYSFLRRYARCAKVDFQLLTLARYILETSLMDYTFATVSDSKLASAALLLALKMKNMSGWTPALEYYSGYKLEDFKHLVYLLNSMLHQNPYRNLKTIRSKYSHKIFFKVALVPLIQDLDL